MDTVRLNPSRTRAGPRVRLLSRWARAPLLALLLHLTGCDSPTVTLSEERLPPTEVADPLIQTDARSYELTVGPDWYSVNVPYTFDNRTGGAVYLVNCQGGFRQNLQRWDGKQWVDAWSPVLLACLSEPIVIAAGASFADALAVWGGAPSSNFSPRFEPEYPSGTYRVVWHDALSTYQDRVPFGEPIPLDARVSNTFELHFP